MLQLPEAKLRETLLKEKLIKAEAFDKIITDVKRLNQNLAEVLISKEIFTEDYYYSLLSSYYGVEMVSLSSKKIDEKILLLIPENIARQKRVIAFHAEDKGVIDVAMDDPTDLNTVEFLRVYLKHEVKVFLVRPSELRQGFSVYAQLLSQDFKQIIEKNVQASLRAKLEGKKEEEAANDFPVVALFNSLISYALFLRASDIHIEVFEDFVLVRLRIDGILREIVRFNKEAHPYLLARIKLLAGLKIDEHYKPQDGRLRYQSASDIVDIRVSILPTMYGEKAEMRLLLGTNRPLSFAELGMMDYTIKAIEENIKKTFGIILVTGPTGSGKTTTLYSVLNILNNPGINIITIEDPIEYAIPYVNQIQVNTTAGLTFASGLRSILRQDPNVVLVGEIRDEETAEISVHAALTGHLVLSSLHTNDSTSTIPRMVDLKIQPFLIAATLNAALAQRLVRKICVDCIVSYAPEKDVIETINKQIKEAGESYIWKPQRLYRGLGCANCNEAGYRGRFGVYEVLNMTEEVRRSIIGSGFNLDNLKKIAIKEGMVTMLRDGLNKAEQGLTTIEEVLRVLKE